MYLLDELLRANFGISFLFEGKNFGQINMYAGDEECKDVFNILKNDAKSVLVDVRTTREWETIGVPDLSELSKGTVFTEWQTFPTMEVNPNFAEQVDGALKSQGVSKEDAVFFICRTGGRSQSAAIALTQLGYTKAYNVLGGFEGAPDANGERSKVNGWVFEGLPHNIKSIE